MQAIVVYNIGVIDEQPRTVVAFKFKRPLPGCRDVDKPLKSGNEVSFQPTVGKRMMGALKIEILDRGLSHRRGVLDRAFRGETLDLHAEPSRE